MKKYTLLLVLVLPLFISSQNKEYYTLTNLAELDIVAENYTAAVKNYAKAFKLTKEPKTLDITNFLKCSCLSETNQTVTDNLIQKLFQRGLTAKDITNDKVLKKCLKTNSLKNNTTVLDTLYRQAINELDIKDQLYRIKKGSYRKYGKEIDSIDNENVATLLKLIKEKGFPSEAKIGVDNSSGYQNWRIVVWHYQQTRSIEKNKPDLFSGILHNALKNDYITPLLYSIYVEIQNDSTYLKYKTTPLIVFKKGEYRILKSTLANLKQIDANRTEIGLCSLKNYVQKIIYQERNKYDFYFGIKYGVFDLSTQEKAIKKKLKEKTTVLNIKKL